MELADLRDLITNEPKLKWALTDKTTLKYPHINFQMEFNGVLDLYKFILQQIEGWERYDNLPAKFTAVKSKFENYKSKVANYFQSSGSRNTNQWNQIKSSIVGESTPMFVHDCPEVEFLLSIITNMNPSTFTGAYNYIVSTSPNQSLNINNKEILNGTLLAYEYKLKGISELSKRRTSEKIALSHLRNDFRKYLPESESELSAHLQGLKDKSLELSQFIDELRDSKEKEISKWFDHLRTEIDDYYTKTKESLAETTRVYEEKLRLSAPAKYWHERAKSLRVQSMGWLGSSIITLIVAIAVLFIILNRFHGRVLLDIFNDTGQAIKWSLLLLILISFLAYGIRIFTKLTFSSFHLARDAEEREQLTYIYLSLVNEKNIDDTERHLIMQALFSRAESGLLKDDGSPSMPGNLLSQAITTTR